MGEVMFVLKTFFASVLVVLLMQVKINSRTIENHALVWLHESAVTLYLQQVALGAAKGIHRIETQAHVFFKDKFGKKNSLPKDDKTDLNATDDVDDSSDVQKASR